MPVTRPKIWLNLQKAGILLGSIIYHITDIFNYLVTQMANFRAADLARLLHCPRVCAGGGDAASR